MDAIFETREQWLAAAAEELAPLFTRNGYRIPNKIRFACSWPAGSRGGKKVLGQCVAPEASADGNTEVYVVPTIAEPAKVLGVLVHELVHAAVGVRHGHKAPFKRACAALGLEGKATQALPGEALKRELAPVLELLGAYPHAPVNLDGRKKQGTRMLKVSCPQLKDEKGKPYSVRMTRSWIETFGLPYSPKVLQPDGSYLGGCEMQLVDEGEGEGEE